MTEATSTIIKVQDLDNNCAYLYDDRMIERVKSVGTGWGGWAILTWEELRWGTGRSGKVVRTEQAYARFELLKGRLTVVEVYFPPPFKLSDLRSFRLGEFEALVNTDAELREGLISRLDEIAVPQLERAAEYFFVDGTALKPDNWIGRMYWSQIEGSGEPKPRRLSSARIIEVYKPDPPDLALQLPADGVKPYPEDFFRAVASAYRSAVSAGSRSPAGDIADQNEVPVTTVHRWIRRARELGLLAAGTQGKRG